MQNHNQPTSNAVTPDEAQQVLSTWSNQQQARGVDPGVDSVQALAAGLGVTETQVRQMLEDIRVQHRSQEIAAGIIDQQQMQRKKSDVNAAIGAAAALVIIIGAIFAFFLFSGQHSVNPNGLPKLPPRVINIDDTENVVNVVLANGTTIGISSEGYNKTTASGGVVVLQGDPAVKAAQQDVSALTEENAKLKSKSELTDGEKNAITKNEGDIEILNRGIDILKSNSAPTPPPAQSD